MQVVPGDDTEPGIWEQFACILREATGRSVELSAIDRHEFYARSRQAFAVVATGEQALYANLILVKGVVA